uniref:ATP synthase subunit a n=1 Tax=Amerotyphlops reticulatus TaxID=534403 RepID=B3GT21_9SAUR|nr:ATP synthase F0 subunit 6 [Amerotyphlops reticulatus]ACD85891.1 ATP synthase F0 subunit 6 [Amerotyphlops reticulatus]
MHLNMFDQFKCPEVFFIPTLIPTMMMIILLFRNTAVLMGGRTSTLLSWITKQITKNLMSQLSPMGQKWTNLLMALLMFILLSNLMGLLPYTFFTTSQLSMNMAMALPLWLGTVVLGFFSKPNSATAHFLPEGSPAPLSPMLILIETVSLLIRPVALGVRLTANITAGHLLIHMVSHTTMELLDTKTILPCMTVTLLLALTFLEIAVACIQAYVFTLLLSLYLEENT